MMTLLRFCAVCGSNKPLDEYYDDHKDKTFGKSKTCSECMKTTAKRHYRDNKAKSREAKLKSIHIMGAKCYRCGWGEDPEALRFEGQIPATRLPSGKPKKTLGTRIKDWNIILDNPSNYHFYYKLICLNCSSMSS